MSGQSADEGDEGAPPPSQSHFAKFEHFTPNEAASFDDEFARLASSQQWVPGSQEYTRQRTIAIKEELELHYFSQPQQLDDIDEEELSEEEKNLQGYQALCREVGIDPSDSIPECKRYLKNTLVNIVDLIDARRTGKRVKVWDNFEEFRAYTLLDKNRIDLHEAKRPPGYLASLLQRLSGSPSRRKRNRGRKLGVASGRVAKHKG
ncbi:hypothetical protein C7999DRAFT_30551 [Corynascus novoguineensis]|uniref:Uncharacterized protein n=1 Tax=Corynascus novoguineensis TaxID=1126955 RepID=A0AAN7HR04_9PEZI|nr:hypothetical protein C7999DRAFT_30551 [Corynascus novoguineensis]